MEPSVPRTNDDSPRPCGRGRSNPLAIVGYACRLPGGVKSPSDLWELCRLSQTGWSTIPEHRFSKDLYWHPDPSKLGTFNTRGGYFLSEDPANFDAQFFQMTAAEAIAMDPQQRLLLEIVFEALESAGLSREQIAGTDTGVFIGGTNVDYDLNGGRDIATAPMHHATGNAVALLSNRVSYVFDLHGPSTTYDTACSSSLVALHHATLSIESGECSQAIVGGCHLNLLPDSFVGMSLSQLFNEDGVTYAFDHRGQSGFARGEGAGCVIIKPLEAAIRDGDPVRALLMSSGVNQDGRTRGITVPNGDAQRDLIRRVYEKAGLNPLDCGYAEMHGTGTKVGDPIEASAVHDALARGRSHQDSLYIGSLKTNIGHLEGASGVASLIKAVMMLEKGFILPSANFEKPNEQIPMAEWHMKVATEVMAWPSTKKFVSVSNYGFGGANAHAVLAKAPEIYQQHMAEPNASSLGTEEKLIVLSAGDQSSLEQRLRDLESFVLNSASLDLDKLAYTLGQRRSHLPSRLSIVANLATLQEKLENVPTLSERVINVPTITFVFTGQGAQWPNMGTDLLVRFPIFEAAIKRADQRLGEIGAGFSLLGELKKEPQATLVHEAHMSQPLCTAIQIALVDLLASWNVRPAAVIGHSSGEIACAYAAGIIDADAAIEVAYFRGRVVQLFRDKFPTVSGAMLAVGASKAIVEPMVSDLKSKRAVIACVNSPSNVTVSGDAEAIAELQTTLAETAVFNRRLRVDVAYHSPHMEEVADDYLAAIKHVRHTTTHKAVFYSSLLGRVARPGELTPEYWIANLVSPVIFSDALSAMYASNDLSGPSPDLLVEIGPHPALKGPVRDILQHIGGDAISTVHLGSLVRNQNDTLAVLQLAGSLFRKGVDVDLEAVNFSVAGSKSQKMITDLPKYAWNHKTRYWHESRISRNHLFSKFQRNDILGSLSEYSSSVEPVWRNMLRLDELPWLRDHRMQGMPVFPMAGFMVLGFEAASQRADMRNIGFDSFELREFVINQALVLKEGVDVEITTSLRSFVNATIKANDLWDELTICSYEADQGWTEHVRALITVRSSKQGDCEVQEGLDGLLRSTFCEFMEVVKQEAVDKVDIPKMYNTLQAIGAGYGPMFQGLEGAHSSDHYAYASLIAPDTASTMPRKYETNFIIHPASLDLAFQCCWPIFGAGRQGMDLLYMPISLERMTISREMPLRRPGDSLQLWGRGNRDKALHKPTSFSLFASSLFQTKEPCFHIENLIMTPVLGSGRDDAIAGLSLCFRYDWEDMDQTQNETREHLDGLSSHETTEDPTLKHVLPELLEVEEELVVAAFTAEDEPIAAAVASDISTLMGSEVAHGRLDITDVDNRLIIVIGLSQTFLADADVDTLDMLQNLFLGANGTIWIHPTGREDIRTPDSSMIIGLTRSVRSETAASIVTLGLENPSSLGASEAIVRVLQSVWGPTNGQYKNDREFVERHGRLCVPRVVSDDKLDRVVHGELGGFCLQEQPYHQTGRRFKIAIERPGALDSLFFIDDTAELTDDEIELDVKATGVNFKDIVVAMGQLQQPYMGLEVAGVVRAIGKSVVDARVSVGQRVMAMVEGGYSTATYCRPSSVCPIPDGLSFEAACSIPVVYCTAFYSLFDLGHLEKGDKILIHAAAGGVGQAAIMLAKFIGAEVFATVGSKAKKQEIMDRYGISEDHIFYSRDTSFAPALQRATNGHGVDVVLNSLAGDLLRETWGCIATFGRFIEIGKIDITRNSRLDMKHFDRNISFSSVDLSKVAAEKPLLMSRLLDDVCKLITYGSIAPIPMTTYCISNIEQAFRALQSGKSVGKLVVVPSTDAMVKATLTRTSAGTLRSDATYVLIGGMGGLGCSMAKWMVEKGARNIVLTSRSAKITHEVQDVLQHAKAWGANIVIKTNDVTDADAVSALVEEELKLLPPIRGVIQGAMVLRDVLFENMVHEEWEAVVRCKVTGTWNLHRALSQSPLDFFVCLGSCTGTIGNRGQSAYAAANVFLDHFVQWRNSQGLPGTCIDLSAVQGVGYLAREKDRQEEVFRTIGGKPITENEVLALLAAAITGQASSSCDSVYLTGLQANAASRDMFWAQDARFQRLFDAFIKDDGGVAASAESRLSVSQALRTAESTEDALEAVYEALSNKIASVLMLTPEEVRRAHSVLSAGLDSLVAIEVRNWITREAGASVQILEIQNSPSLKSLAKTILDRSSFSNEN
ncbi:hypothetical protein NM208_g974 [Fusarium decemcellulare]|uniref:Uncharacterized protein n=1 Tax=Fusarium decemcellulare TaxID=57161 RepID=A0ACC1SXI4_9HYPO|nr:hypothetical protein NM208_g974 [Fusarium decemcellulare]